MYHIRDIPCLVFAARALKVGLRHSHTISLVACCAEDHLAKRKESRKEIYPDHSYDTRMRRTGLTLQASQMCPEYWGNSKPYQVPSACRSSLKALNHITDLYSGGDFFFLFYTVVEHLQLHV